MTEITRKYRSRIRIYYDILSAIQTEGGYSRITKILYKANMPYDRLVRYITELIDKDLVMEEKIEDATVYALTMKGSNFTRKLREIIEFLESFGFKV